MAKVRIHAYRSDLFCDLFRKPKWFWAVDNGYTSTASSSWEKTLHIALYWAGMSWDEAAKAAQRARATLSKESS